VRRRGSRAPPLLAEFWWADRIAAPSFREMGRWLTGVAPWMVFAQVFPQPGRASTWMRHRPRRDDRAER